MIQAEGHPQETHSDSLPIVSVIIPAYNAALYIAEAIDSVLDQSFRAHETIVINDGSPDTDELELELRKYDGRILYLRQENLGAAAARNAGLRVARGELVGFLDADDRWLPNFLEKQIEFRNSSDADLVFCDALISGESPLAGRTYMEMQPSRGPVTPESLLLEDVAVLTSAVVARRKPIMEVGLFDETMKRGHDFDLWLRLAKAGKRLAYQSVVLAHHRIIETGLSGNMTSQLQRSLDVLEAIKRKELLTTSETAALHFNRNVLLRELALETGKQKLLRKDFVGARQSFDEAKEILPSWKLCLVLLGLRVAPQIVRGIYNRRLLWLFKLRARRKYKASGETLRLHEKSSNSRRGDHIFKDPEI